MDTRRKQQSHGWKIDVPTIEDIYMQSICDIIIVSAELLKKQAGMANAIG